MGRYSTAREGSVLEKLWESSRWQGCYWTWLGSNSKCNGAVIWTQSYLLHLYFFSSNQVPLTTWLLAWHLGIEGLTLFSCILPPGQKIQGVEVGIVAGRGVQGVQGKGCSRWTHEKWGGSPSAKPLPGAPETTLPSSSEQGGKGLTQTLWNVHPGRAFCSLTPWGYYCFGYMKSLRMECLITGLNPTYKSNISS